MPSTCTNTDIADLKLCGSSSSATSRDLMSGFATAFSEASARSFPTRLSKSVRYNAAVNHSRTVQNRAFATYQKELSVRLADMSKCDKKFWQLAKEIGGVESSRSGAAPSPEALASAFAEKMSNGKDVEDESFEPQDETSIPLSSWKIRRKRVYKVLSIVDASKSANGASPVFWKETSRVISDAVTKLLKKIVRKATWPSAWKTARVTPPHKRGSVTLPGNYRPLSVLINLSVYVEDVMEPQFDKWISKHIPNCQFGFVKGTGTNDYGAALSLTMQAHLDKRGEGILISLDAKGAFDRVW